MTLAARLAPSERELNFHYAGQAAGASSSTASTNGCAASANGNADAFIRFHSTATVARVSHPCARHQDRRDTNNNKNGASKPGTPIAPIAPVAPASLASPVPMEPSVISAPLAELSEDWPEGLRLEITKLNLSDAQVLLPANLIEPALKHGRVTFLWQNLRPLIKPKAPPASIHDGIELELPLKVIAPLFLVSQRAALRPRQTILPPADIPNLFFGFPQPSAEAPAKTPVMETPVKAPVVETPEKAPVKAQETEVYRPALKLVEARPTDSNYYTWSDGHKRPGRRKPKSSRRKSRRQILRAVTRRRRKS